MRKSNTVFARAGLQKFLVKAQEFVYKKEACLKQSFVIAVRLRFQFSRR